LLRSHKPCFTILYLSNYIHTGVTHPITVKSDNIVHPEQMTNVKLMDTFALVVQPVIVKRDMEINSNMPMFHMMIYQIQDFVVWVGRVLLIIAGKLLMYGLLWIKVHSLQKLIINNETIHKTKQTKQPTHIVVLTHTAHLALQKNVPKGIAATVDYHVMSKI